MQVIDYVPESARDTVQSFGNGTSSSLYAQSFAGTGHFLSGATFYLKTGGGSINVDMIGVLYAHSGTFGSTSITTGAPLATSTNTISTSTVTGSWAAYTFTFDETFQLAKGTYYCIGINTPVNSGVPGDYLHIGSCSNTAIHPGNMSNGTPSPFARDLVFSVYGIGKATNFFAAMV